MIKMTCTGATEAMVNLRNVSARVQANARKVMHRAADKIVKKAGEFAPVDKHNLEEAIEKRVGYDSARNGRLAIDIGLKDMVNGVDVSVYGVQMHEGEYNLGPGSIEKQMSTGKRVGPGFITRAFDEVAKTLPPEIKNAVDEEIK